MPTHVATSRIHFPFFPGLLQLRQVLARVPFLARRRLLSHCALTCLSSRMCVEKGRSLFLSSSYKATSPVGSGSNPYDLI